MLTTTSRCWPCPECSRVPTRHECVGSNARLYAGRVRSHAIGGGLSMNRDFLYEEATPVYGRAEDITLLVGITAVLYK